MTRIWRTLAVCLYLSVPIILPAIGMAADFELFWDPNCNADADLEGYYIYYKEEASVVDDPSGAVDVYVALTDIDFDSDNPSYLIAELLDDVRYCFAVTAWYGDEESGFSNEVCGINGTYAFDTDPPVADAGGPYEVIDTDDSGSEAVTLDSSASSDSDGTITSYQWFENGTQIGTGVNPTVSFAVGTHTVTLTVTDNDNATHSDDTTVTVNPASNELPVANAGGPYEATDSNNSGSEAVALDGSASWDSDGTVTNYQWFEDGTLIGSGVNPTLSFAVGTHTVTLTVTDNDNAKHSNETTVIINSGPSNTPPNGVIDSPAGNQTIYVGESAHFFGVGSDPDGDTPLSYRWQFGAGSGIDDYTIDDSPGDIFFHNAGTFTVTFTVTDSKETADPTPDTRVITVVEKSVSGPVAKTDWRLVYVDSEELVAIDGAATNAFDGDSGTMWHTEWGSKDNPAHPHEIIIDLGHTYDLGGFNYEPYKRRGRIADYEFFVSTGSTGPWTSVSSGTFSNGANVKSVSFPVTTGRYIRLVAYSEAKAEPWTSAVEIGITGIRLYP